jgi:ubiquinone biosynthesis protein
MIHSFRQFARMLKISAILSRYRLDEFLEGSRLSRPMSLLRVFAPWTSEEIAGKPRGERLRLALNEMGPIYVKFGQIISTRRDLVAPDIADELALLQDRVPPFPGAEAQAIVEQVLGKPVDELFGSFDSVPMASASIIEGWQGSRGQGRKARNPQADSPGYRPADVDGRPGREVLGGRPQGQTYTIRTGIRDLCFR